MQYLNYLYSIVYLLLNIILTHGSFNPFMDNELFMINWAGSAVDLNKKENVIDDNLVVVMTSKNEKYQCVLPESKESREEKKKSYTGLSANELMETLFSQTACSYRIESYWTYELCHGKHLRQYHEVKEPGKKTKVQEYFLGKGREGLQTKGEDTTEKVKDTEQHIKIRKIDGLELPYYEVVMPDGTKCDLTNQPRMARIMYVCQPEGHGEIYELKETSTCEYDVMVLTSVLCSHPDFRPKNAPVNQIQCLPLDNAPKKPHQLEQIERESSASEETQTFSTMNAKKTEKEGEVEEEEEALKDVPPPVKRPMVIRKKPPEQPVSQALGSTTDKQVLREFLSGDHCLTGGSGWWKYEFCYGRFARQYHDDPEGRTIVHLGFWDEAKHKQWIKHNPSKRMRPVGDRRMISLFFSEGDTCEVTGNKRFVEVRLKCVTNTQHPHSVALYLMEPNTCEYVLGVESPIFCSLLDQADEYGLLKNVDLKT